MKFFALLVILAFGFTACATSTESEPANVQAGVVNTLCPVAGTAVDETKTVEYDGMTVGFCCENCMGSWQGMTTEEKNEALAKVKM